MAKEKGSDKVTKKPIKRHKMAVKEQRAAYIFLIPAFLGLSLITYLPVLASFAIGFTNLRVGHFMKVVKIDPLQFTGLENYIQIFTRPDIDFLNAIKVTVYFSVLAVIGSVIYSLIIAMLLNRKMPARAFFRAIFYIPYILSATAVMIGWKFLLESDGLFNYILVYVFGMDKIHFLQEATTVIPTLAVIAVWTCGNLIVIFLAGLQNVPREYHEAAEIDGANFWQRFWNITIPCMTPIIFYNLLMSLVVNLQVVVPALAVTGGAPGKATMFMSYMIYNRAFVSGDFGKAGAMAFVFFVVAAILAAILFATSNRWIFYEGGDE